MYEGDRYDLRHLHHDNWNLTLSCDTCIPAFIIFSSHCYTDSIAPEGRQHLQIPDYNGNLRFFCPVRYRLSLKLKQWIQCWDGEVCYLSRDAQRGNESWIIVEGDGEVPVKVAFAMSPNRKNARGVFLRIKSVHAYEWSAPPGRPHPHLPYRVLLRGEAIGRKTPEPREKRGAR